MRATPPLPRLPNLYLGTMTFSWKGQTSSYVDDSIASKMLNTFDDFHDQDGPVRIDTARIYAGGDSERMLGRSNLDNFPAITMGTKAHPSQPNGLSPQGIRAQLQSSLDAMGLSTVNEYYLHQPDTEHSLLDSLKTLNELVEEGKISAIGMSNYHASEVQRAFDLCNEHGLAAKPSVYQGLYNPLNRCVEDDLLPVLRENGCSFVAYNPLAAGLLTGKHLADGEVKDGRFKNNQNYLPRFYTPANFQALELIQSACKDTDITMVEASYRWLLRHSALQSVDDDDSSGDGVLIGASSMQQLEENLRCCASAKESELPQPVLDAFDAAWNIIKNDQTAGGPFPYWRSYSSDMPDRESLDHGASYNAAKAK